MFGRPLVNVLGATGSALGVIGFFLPFRTEIFTGIYGSVAQGHPASRVLSDSFWQMLVNTIQGGSAALFFPWPLEGLLIGVFLLSILFPLGMFLGALLGKQKYSLLLLSLFLAFLGFLEFVCYSALLLDTFSRVATPAVGPGFWLMFIGFIVSIGSTLRKVTAVL
jgi:hypothetical protein